MAILNRFLRVLELLEQAAELANWLTGTVELAAISALLSYGSLLLVGCEAPSAAILASTLALTLHCGLNHPDS